MNFAIAMWIAAVLGAHGQTELHGAPASAASAASTMHYTPEERAEGLRQGWGIGLATAAELNGYPGPRHVLELGDQLALSADQRERTRRLFDSMQADAQRLGARLLGEEEELDAIFRDHRATPALLENTARRIGEIEADLKVVHLRTHLAMLSILTPGQVARYVALRRSGAGSGKARPSPQEEHRHQARGHY